MISGRKREERDEGTERRRRGGRGMKEEGGQWGREERESGDRKRGRKIERGTRRHWMASRLSLKWEGKCDKKNTEKGRKGGGGEKGLKR